MGGERQAKDKEHPIIKREISNRKNISLASQAVTGATWQNGHPNKKQTEENRNVSHVVPIWSMVSVCVHVYDYLLSFLHYHFHWPPVCVDVSSGPSFIPLPPLSDTNHRHSQCREPEQLHCVPHALKRKQKNGMQYKRMEEWRCGGHGDEIRSNTENGKRLRRQRQTAALWRRFFFSFFLSTNSTVALRIYYLLTEWHPTASRYVYICFAFDLFFHCSESRVTRRKFSEHLLSSKRWAWTHIGNSAQTHSQPAPPEKKTHKHAMFAFWAKVASQTQNVIMLTAQ